MSKLPITLLLFVLLVANSCILTGQQQTDKQSYSTNEADKLLVKYDLPNAPGLVVSIAKDGKRLYNKSVGISNLEYEIPITSSTVFHVASVSKQFTVFSILLLEKEGKLSLEDDIRIYLPEIKMEGHKITLRNLASHTSGIRDNTTLAYLTGTLETDPLTNDQILELIMNQNGLNFAPGEQFQYCNSGFILLAEIVKRVSGESFADFTQSRIFTPLKMLNTRFVDDPGLIVKNKAYSYLQQDEVYYKSLLNHSFVGSTGLNTTSEDLMLWAQNFEYPVVGDEGIFNQMKKRTKLNSGEEISYALGQDTKYYKGLNVIFHGGGDAGYRSYLLRIPEHHFSMVILGNSQSFNPLDIAFELVDLFMRDLEQISEVPKTIGISDEITLSKYDGNYEVFPGFIVTISHNKDTLFHQMPGDNTKTVLDPIDANSFVYPAIPHSKIVFNTSDKSEVNKFSWHFSDFSYPGFRINLQEFDETKIDLLELEGIYRSEETKTSYTLVVREKQLFATHPIHGDILLSPFQPDSFISNWSFFGKIEITRNTQNQVTGFNLSGQNALNITFEKKCVTSDLASFDALVPHLVIQTEIVTQFVNSTCYSYSQGKKRIFG